MVITIRRKKKVEAVRAMFDLLSKGWEISHPLTEKNLYIRKRSVQLSNKPV
jgi:hypothetical protein